MQSKTWNIAPNRYYERPWAVNSNGKSTGEENGMAEELISVIMSTYNEKEEWLRDCIESVLKQSYRNLEFIIVLDRPENEMLREVILEYQKQDSRIIFVPNEKNIGLVASLNRALEYAHGVYVARIDADDICDPQRFRIQMEAMKEQDADFVISAIDFIHDDGQLVEGASDERFGPKAFAQVMKYGNVAHHSTWLLKKTVYDRLEGYREVRYCEDLEFVLRALQEGTRVIKIPDHTVQYRLRENSVSRNFAMEQAMKARYIRQKYAKGERVADISPQFLNQQFSGYRESQKQRFDQADRILSSFCQHMAEHRWGACFREFFRGFCASGYFRMLFTEYFISWSKRKKLADKGA